MKNISTAMVFLLLAVLLVPVVAQVTDTIESVRGVALIIGNAAYVGTRPLANPVNDAHDVAAAMEKLG